MRQQDNIKAMMKDGLEYKKQLFQKSSVISKIMTVQDNMKAMMKDGLKV